MSDDKLTGRNGYYDSYNGRGYYTPSPPLGIPVSRVPETALFRKTRNRDKFGPGEIWQLIFLAAGIYWFFIR